MSKLSKLAIVKDICVALTAHQTTPIMVRGDLDYPRPDMYKIKGGGTFADKADNVIITWRPFRKSQLENRTVRILIERVRKQRLVGIPGEIDLFYSRAKNQYYETIEKVEDKTYFNCSFRQAEQTTMAFESEESIWDLNPNRNFETEKEQPF
jgi:hypothetical protein